MIFTDAQLNEQRDQKEAEQNQRTDRLANVKRHREQIAARFAQRSRRNFHDPEKEGDFRNFVHRVHDSFPRNFTL